MEEISCQGPNKVRCQILQMNVEGLGVEREGSLHHPASKMKFFIYEMKQYVTVNTQAGQYGVYNARVQ